MSDIITVGVNINEQAEAERESRSAFVRFAAVFFIVLTIIASLKTFVFMHVEVEGSSMENTMVDGDAVIVDKLAKIERGDVVVFKVKGVVMGETDENKMYIKRVIGIPGDTVWSENGVVYYSRDGVLETIADGDYVKGLTYLNYTARKTDIPKTVVPEGCYFLMGDNRAVSFDCRYFGEGRTPKCVSEDYICGVVPSFVIENKDSELLKALMRFV